MCRGRTCTSLILFTVAKVAQFSIRSRGAVGFPPAIRLSPFGEPKCQAGSTRFLRSRCRRIEGNERLICSGASCKTDRLIRRCRSRYKEKSWEVSEEARQGLFCRRTKHSKPRGKVAEEARQGLYSRMSKRLNKTRKASEGKARNHCM